MLLRVRQYGVGMPLVWSKWEDHTAPRKDGLIRPDGHAGIAGSTGQSMIQVRRSGSNLVASSVCIRGSRGLPLGAATWTAVHTARAAGARAAAQPPEAATRGDGRQGQPRAAPNRSCLLLSGLRAAAGAAYSAGPPPAHARAPPCKCHAISRSLHRCILQEIMDLRRWATTNIVARQ